MFGYFLVKCWLFRFILKKTKKIMTHKTKTNFAYIKKQKSFFKKINTRPDMCKYSCKYWTLSDRYVKVRE